MRKLKQKIKWNLEKFFCSWSETGHTYTTYRVQMIEAGMSKLHFMKCIKCGKKKRKVI